MSSFFFFLVDIFKAGSDIFFSDFDGERDTQKNREKKNSIPDTRKTGVCNRMINFIIVIIIICNWWLIFVAHLVKNAILLFNNAKRFIRFNIEFCVQFWIEYFQCDILIIRFENGTFWL